MEDEEIAGAPEGETEEDTEIISMKREHWQKVLRQGVRAQLLDVAETGSVSEVLAFLWGKGIQVGEDEEETVYS